MGSNTFERLKNKCLLIKWKQIKYNWSNKMQQYVENKKYVTLF